MESAGKALNAIATGQPSKADIAAMKPKDQVKHYLTANKDAIARAMPKHMSAERLLQVATTAILTTPKLLECYLPSLIGGVVQCGQMGLEPNTVLGHAYLVPFKNTKKNRKDVQVIIGYKGFIDLARRSGHIVSIAAHAVYENDEFKYRYGLNEQLDHLPAEGDRGKITHFYAVAHMKDGGHAFEVLTKLAVDKIRATTNGRDNAVWDKHYEEMGRKTAIRRLSKFLPLSVELATAVAMDEAAGQGTQGDLSTVLDGDFTVDTGGSDDDDAGQGAGGLTEGAEKSSNEQKQDAGQERARNAPERRNTETDANSQAGAVNNAQQAGNLGGTVNKSSGEIVWDEATVKDRIMTARTRQALDDARSLINSVDDVEPYLVRERLSKTANAKEAGFDAVEGKPSGGRKRG